MQMLPALRPYEWLSCTLVVVSGIIGCFVYSGVSVVGTIETQRAVLYIEIDFCTALCGRHMQSPH